jgi:hypothetical protein
MAPGFPNAEALRPTRLGFCKPINGKGLPFPGKNLVDRKSRGLPFKLMPMANPAGPAGQL